MDQVFCWFLFLFFFLVVVVFPLFFSFLWRDPGLGRWFVRFCFLFSVSRIPFLMTVEPPF